MSLAAILGSTSGLGLSSVFVLPSIISSSFVFLFLFSLFLLYDESPSIMPDVTILLDKVKSLNIEQNLFILIAIIIFSLTTISFDILLIRFLEGYWSSFRLLNWIRDIAKDIQLEKKIRLSTDEIDISNINKNDLSISGKLQKKISDNVEKKEVDLPVEELFPRDSRILPTGLGNILRASEDYAESRYGINSVTVWPRIYSVISDNLRRILDEQRFQLEFSVRCCIAFLICTGISIVFCFIIVYKASISDPIFNLFISNIDINNNLSDIFLYISLMVSITIKYIVWFAIPTSTLILALLNYKAATEAAISYGNGIKTAFDLHRFDLLKALHLPLPKNLKEEKEENNKLTNFLLSEPDNQNILNSENNIEEWPIYYHDDQNKDQNQKI